MLHVQQQDSGRLIEGTILFAPSTPHTEYINCTTEMGDIMRYEKLAYSLIDFPGEYDIKGLQIKVFQGKNKKLNYFCATQTMKFGIVQSPNILETEDEFSSTDAIVYTDDTIISKLDQIEYEGEKYKIDITI